MLGSWTKFFLPNCNWWETSTNKDKVNRYFSISCILGKSDGANDIYLSDLEIKCLYILKELPAPKEVRSNPYVFALPSTNKYR